MLEQLLSIFFPATCYNCGEVGDYLCKLCHPQKIFYKNFHVCHVCKKRVEKEIFIHENCRKKTYLDGVIVALKYDKFIEHLIADFKYEFIKDLKFLLSSFLKIGFEKFPLKKNFVVTFVPLHPKRKRWRGYNQAEELAKIFAKETGKEVYELLERKKFSRTQVGLKRKERLENIKEVFIFKGDFIPKRVLIIDDVMTTGATLEESAKALKESGVGEVYGLVITRG